jgi:hypothetical protein
LSRSEVAATGVDDADEREFGGAEEVVVQPEWIVRGERSTLEVIGGRGRTVQL